MTSQLYLHLNCISLTHEAEHSRCPVAHRQRFDMYGVDISVKITFGTHVLICENGKLRDPCPHNYLLCQSHCLVKSRVRQILQCTMCTLFSTMPLYLLWTCSHYNKKKGWIQGHTKGEITDQSLKITKVWKNVFSAHSNKLGANICSMGYQNSNFKIALSLFSCAENILNKVHIVQWG